MHNMLCITCTINLVYPSPAIHDTFCSIISDYNSEICSERQKVQYNLNVYV